MSEGSNTKHREGWDEEGINNMGQAASSVKVKVADELAMLGNVLDKGKGQVGGAAVVG